MFYPYIEIFLYILTGLIAGFLSGLLGIGGGIIVVPSLLVIFHFLEFPSGHLMQTAVGTSLTAMVLTAGSSALAHMKGINWFLIKALLPGLIIGSILGAVIAHLLPTEHLQIVFGIFMLLFGIYFLVISKEKELEIIVKPNFVVIGLIGIFIGALSSILGIGGGLITVPVLTFLGASMSHAISTSAVTGFFIAIIGALSFVYLGLTQKVTDSLSYVYIPAFLIIGLTASLAAPLGAKYAYSTPTRILKRIFGIYQIVIGFIMIYF